MLLKFGRELVRHFIYVKINLHYYPYVVDCEVNKALYLYVLFSVSDPSCTFNWDQNGSPKSLVKILKARGKKGRQSTSRSMVVELKQCMSDVL